MLTWEEDKRQWLKQPFNWEMHKIFFFENSIYRDRGCLTKENRHQSGEGDDEKSPREVAGLFIASIAWRSYTLLSGKNIHQHVAIWDLKNTVRKFSKKVFKKLKNNQKMIPMTIFRFDEQSFIEFPHLFQSLLKNKLNMKKVETFLLKFWIKPLNFLLVGVPYLCLCWDGTFKNLFPPWAFPSSEVSLIGIRPDFLSTKFALFHQMLPHFIIYVFLKVPFFNGATVPHQRHGFFNRHYQNESWQWWHLWRYHGALNGGNGVAPFKFHIDLLYSFKCKELWSCMR